MPLLVSTGTSDASTSVEGVPTSVALPDVWSLPATTHTTATTAAVHRPILAIFCQFLAVGSGTAAAAVRGSAALGAGSGAVGACPSSWRMRRAMVSTSSRLATASSSLMPSSMRSISISA